MGGGGLSGGIVQWLNRGELKRWLNVRVNGVIEGKLHRTGFEVAHSCLELLYLRF